MKGPLAQLLLLSVFVAIGLWVGVKWFLGRTNELSSNNDMRAISSLREETNGGAEPKPAWAAVRSAEFVPSEPSQILERNSRIESQSQTKDDEAQQKSSDEDEQASTDDEPAPEDAVEEAEEEADEQIETLEVIEVESESEQTPDGEAQQGARNESAGGRQASTLSGEELQSRQKARQARLAELGLIRKKAPPPTVAVDVSLDMPERCSGAALAKVPVGLKFRHETSVIRGESLNALQSLVALFRQCNDDGKFIVAENPLGRADATDTLRQMRIDEVKYFFIQHSVSIDTVQFPEE